MSKCSDSITLCKVSDGARGDSITIIKQEVQYQISASGTAIPSGAWEDMPKPKKGYYLWTKISIYYSDSPNQPRVTYNVSYIAENPQPLLFAWSSSSVIFTPKDSMRVWMYSNKYVQFDSKLMGDFALYNFVEWDEVIKARSDDYPYLWCKYSEDSDPLPVTGKDGKEGLSVYSSVQYHLDVSASLTTSQLEALPSDSWLEEEQCTWEYGRYIYKRLKKTTVETGAVEYTYQGRDEELENHFKSLLSFKISANRLNYPIDKRALETEKTTIKILIEETYYNPDSYSVTINGEAVTPTIANDSFTFDVPLKTGKDLYNIVVIPVKDEANITDVYGELNIVALDITEYDKFYGAVISLTFSGITLLDGDSCFLTLADGSNEANKIYVYQSNAWVDFNSANLTTDRRMLILSKAQKAALEYANLKGTVAAEYAYIGTLIANYVYAREIGAETITLTGENGKLVGGDYTTEDTDGFLANKGIYLDSTGTAKLNDAKLKNCKIDDATLKNADMENLKATNASITDGTFFNLTMIGGEIKGDTNPVNTVLTQKDGSDYQSVGGDFKYYNRALFNSWVNSNINWDSSNSNWDDGNSGYGGIKHQAFSGTIDSKNFKFLCKAENSNNYFTKDCTLSYEGISRGNYSSVDGVGDTATSNTFSFVFTSPTKKHSNTVLKIVPSNSEIVEISKYMYLVTKGSNYVYSTTTVAAEFLSCTMTGDGIDISDKLTITTGYSTLYQNEMKWGSDGLEEWSDVMKEQPFYFLKIEKQLNYSSVVIKVNYKKVRDGKMNTSRPIYNLWDFAETPKEEFIGNFFLITTSNELVLPNFAGYGTTPSVNVSTNSSNFKAGEGVSDWTTDKLALFAGIKRKEDTNIITELSSEIKDLSLNNLSYSRGTIKYDNVSLLLYSDDSLLLDLSRSKYLKQGEYPSFSFTSISQLKGVYASDLYPKSPDESNIGSPNQKFNNVYAETVNAENVATSNLNSKPVNRYAYIRDDGVMEVGQYLDFHTDNNPNSSSADYNVRLQARSDGLHVYVNGKEGDIGIWGAVFN